MASYAPHAGRLCHLILRAAGSAPLSHLALAARVQGLIEDADAHLETIERTTRRLCRAGFLQVCLVGQRAYYTLTQRGAQIREDLDIELWWRAGQPEVAA